MQYRLLTGQALSVLGLLLLLAFVPFMPQVLGVPYHRMAEMSVFWVGEWLMILGIGQTLRVVAPRPGLAMRPLVAAQGTLAALGVLLAMFVCLASLTNLTYSTIQGAGFLRSLGRRDLFPHGLSYVLALPLGLAVLAQCPVLLSLGQPAALQNDRSLRTGRVVLQSLLGALLVVFLGCCLLATIDRRNLVLCTLSTWLGGILFVMLGMGQVSWSLPAGQLDRGPTT